MSRSRPLLRFFGCQSLVRFYGVLAVTVSSASTVLAVTVSSASKAVFCCHGLVRFGGFWLSRSRPLRRLCHGLVRFYGFVGCQGLVRFYGVLAVTVSSASKAVFCCHGLSSALAVFGCHGLVRFGGCVTVSSASTVFWLPGSRPLLRVLAVTVSSASTVLAVTVSSASKAVFCCHGLVRFGDFWLSRSRPLRRLCHGLVRFYGFLAARVSSASTGFWLSRSRPPLRFWLSRSRPLLRPFFVVTVSSALAVFGCHGLVRFGGCVTVSSASTVFWLPGSRPLLRGLAVTVSSASTVLAVTVSSASKAVFCCHGLVRFGGFWLSRSRPLRRLCHGLVRFYGFLAARVSSASTGFWLSRSRPPLRFWLSRSRPLLRPFFVVTVSSALAVFGCHGLVRFGGCVTVSSASTVFWLPGSRPLLRGFGCHGLVRLYGFGCHGLVRF